MGLEFESYTAWLLEEVQIEAELRTRDSDASPEDLRISLSSLALRSLALRMRELPSDHPKVQQLWRLWFGCDLPSEQLGQTKSLDLIRIVSEELQQYGCDGVDDGDPEPFVDALTCEFERLFGRDISEFK